MYAAKGIDLERSVEVLNTGCVIYGKICISQGKIMKTVFALEEKRDGHHENIAYPINALTYMTIERSLRVCGIAHCT